MTLDPTGLFFDHAELTRDRADAIAGEALKGADDGELYLEYRRSEAVAYDDGRLRSASFDVSHGFGLRAVAGEAAGYAHSSELSEAALKRAADAVQAVKRGHVGSWAGAPAETNRRHYGDLDPTAGTEFAAKVALMEEIDAYARGRDARVRQVSCSLTGEWRVVEILRPGLEPRRDIRPLVRLNVSVVAGEGEREETGGYGGGGRVDYTEYLKPETWRGAVDEALRIALVNLEAQPCPAGEMEVALGPGWPGVLLHEAVGHGLEGDFNRKQTSAFSGLMGEQVAAKGVTVIDDGTLPDRRGSLSFDDEGEPTSRTVLIEDGRLVGYMQDRLNARLMGESPTGNGRRQSYAHIPMPRMTNTFMLAGTHDPGEITAAMKRGIYAVNFGGGQVDITSGKFVFSCTEAYLVENGEIVAPVKGATLIGDGPTALTKIRLIGNDLKLDPGVGVCGKNGQGVPVGVGQPSLLLDGLTVGGAEAG